MAELCLISEPLWSSGSFVPLRGAGHGHGGRRSPTGGRRHARRRGWGPAGVRLGRAGDRLV